MTATLFSSSRTVLAAILLISSRLLAGGTGKSWPIIKHYDQKHLCQIALPIGGIGTGTISLGGRGDWRDWEIVNRPAKGFNPGAPFFAIRTKTPDSPAKVRAIQGPVDEHLYYGGFGVKDATNPALPCFKNCSFDASYPFGIVNLADPDMPVKVRIKAFNPLVPTDPDASGIPIVVVTYEVTNLASSDLDVSVCGTMENFIGNDGVKNVSSNNRNEFKKGNGFQGIFMLSDSVKQDDERWGTMALTTTAATGVSYRTAWLNAGWGTPILDFWDDFSDDGRLENRPAGATTPKASLAVQERLPSHGTREFTFFITWHFPNRYAWSPTRIGNYYTTQYKDAWNVVEKTVPQLDKLEDETVQFVSALTKSDLPGVVKESALFNLSTLRTQTCFRSGDGRFFAWEGCGDKDGCCFGTCTHVWNYEQAVAFLFGSIAKSMRSTEFGKETDDAGLMSFRVKLPIDSGEWGKAAADGQMGCIMKMYRDWQLSGDNAMLAALWPNVKKALEFCWIKGGWDANKDGVMEGCQHNTMDVEYYGPNPQMGIWYLGALKSAEQMALFMKDKEFAATCRSLFEHGSRWIDSALFNGEYYVHKIIPPGDKTNIAPSLLVGMGSSDFTHPDYQLGNACLVDQLIGQMMAHVSGLGYLTDPKHVRSTLASIMKYNYRKSLSDHFNCLRTFALGDEAALLMASYPHDRPSNPFPYFTEVMTGFEYTAAIGMLYDGMGENGLTCITNLRNRYDGLKRNPYDEAECGHHYGRAMISWGEILALTGFHFSAVNQEMSVASKETSSLWSNGYAYGTVSVKRAGMKKSVTIAVLKGEVLLKTFVLNGYGRKSFDAATHIDAVKPLTFEVSQNDPSAGLPHYGLAQSQK
ncbi:MAG TPA: GH116 family glycosyl-hydrolase [Bacteroidota bacterium]|nr:GH116 family glycosyl-hydrolase [Bacteroidota bacterium]